MKKNLAILFISCLIFASCSKVSKDTDPVPTPTPVATTCTVSSYVETSADGVTSKYTNTYNSDNKVTEYSVINTSTVGTTTTKFTYQEEKANLGSDTMPYLTLLVNNELAAKYYCDKNARVTKVEEFYNATDKFPYSTTFEEYDSNGNNTKTTIKDQNDLNGSFTGDYYVLDATYENGNYTKLYYTGYSNNVVSQQKYLIHEYTATTNAVKTKTNYLFNYGKLSFGEGNQFYAKTRTAYNPNGSVLNKIEYTYKLNADGYLLSQELVNTDGSKSTFGGYAYSCK